MRRTSGVKGCNFLPETATLHVKELCEIVENTAKQNLQPQNILQGDSKNISIHLEERNKTTEEGESSKTTLTGTLCNTVSETQMEQDNTNKTTEEGGSSVNTLTGTECNIVYVNTHE